MPPFGVQTGSGGLRVNRRSFLAALAPLAVVGRQGGARRRPSSPASPAGSAQVLRSVRGVPPEIVGAFREPLAFEQAASGQYFVFDRPGHTVYGIDAAMSGAWKIVEIGHEAGRIIEPSAFALAPNGTFAVADRPARLERIQIFGPGGNLITGFMLPGQARETVMVGSLVLNSSGSLQYDGSSLLLALPETGALVAEYSPGGVPIRTFGVLRATGHESSPDLHLALNAGLPLRTPRGGFVFVFQTGVPLFRRFDAEGRFLYERHIEGPEIDDVLASLPTRWPTRRAEGREIPLVPPVVRTARVDPSGRLWVTFANRPYTYVYAENGEKARVVQFRGAGILSPTSLSFSGTGRLLITPGCYEFDPAA